MDPFTHPLQESKSYYTHTQTYTHTGKLIE